MDDDNVVTVFINYASRARGQNSHSKHTEIKAVSDYSLQSQAGCWRAPPKTHPPRTRCACAQYECIEQTDGRGLVIIRVRLNAHTFGTGSRFLASSSCTAPTARDRRAGRRFINLIRSWTYYTTGLELLRSTARRSV